MKGRDVAMVALVIAIVCLLLLGVLITYERSKDSIHWNRPVPGGVRSQDPFDY